MHTKWYNLDSNVSILGTTLARCIEFCYAEDVGGVGALELPQFYNIIHDLDPAAPMPIENILFGANAISPNGQSLTAPYAVRTSQTLLTVEVFRSFFF